MTKHDFIEAASKAGYCSKKQAEDFCDENPKDIYTEDDFIEAWRFAQRYDYKRRPGHHLGDGNFTSKLFHADGGEEGNR